MTGSFSAWEHVQLTVRMIEDGSLDGNLDAIAKAVSGRRLMMASIALGQSQPAFSVIKAKLAKAVAFDVGDVVKVVSNRAPWRLHGVIGIVSKVNAETVWVTPPPAHPYEGMMTNWSVNTRMTPFQKIKGFRARKEHLIHHV